MRKLARNIAEAWNTRPTAATIPIGITLIGAWALIRGEHVSRAFTNLGGGGLIRICGAAWLTGGILFLVSLRQRDLTYEGLGLTLVMFGSAVYGIGAVFGLGEQGIVAGGISLLIALACLGRIRLLSRAQKRQAQRDRDMP
jgi:Na+/serine symporter